MAEEPKWYVAHTYAGYENKVKANIEKAVGNRGMHERILEIKVPTEEVLEIKDNVRKTVVRKIFPSYVFIKMIMDDESWYIVRNCRGVSGFIGFGSKPVPLSDEEINEMGIEKKTVVLDFAVGDAVRVKFGALEGFLGEIQQINTERQKINVKVDMFGRENVVELDFGQIETLN